MFEKIIPVALNPALDITLRVDGLSSEQINTVLKEDIDAAGKATNVSKVLRRFGVSFDTGAAADTVLLHFFTANTPLGEQSLT